MPGMGNVVNGAHHPLFTPTHMFILVALGLAMGAKKLSGLNIFFAWFIPATALGLSLTFLERESELPILILAILGLTAGANLALALPTDRLAFRAFGIACGLLIGLDSAPEPSLSVAGKLVTLFATLVSITVITADTAFYTSVLPSRHWIQIGFRVVGSWIFAISLLLLAFALRSDHSSSALAS
jgi:hydrogenase/urease accessory protein HupE